MNDVNFNNETTMLVSGSTDNNIILWKYKEDGWIINQKLDSHSNAVMGVLFFPNLLNQLISCSED